jgi:hypothetical protein
MALDIGAATKHGFIALQQTARSAAGENAVI